MQVDTQEVPGGESSARRLIIIVVQPGEEPQVELDPPESFADWEMLAALHRAIEIQEEEIIMEQYREATEEDD